MTPTTRARGVRALVLWLAVFVVLPILWTWWLASSARAQAGVPIHLALARVCWSESGPRDLQECGAVWHALQSRAVRRGVPVADHLDHYAGGVSSPHRTQRRWLAYLSDSSARPTHWPVQLPWEGRWARDWRRLRKHTTWMTSEADAGLWSPCVQPPLDWGVAHAVVRYEARNPRAVRVDCGRTRNVFLVPYPEATP